MVNSELPWPFSRSPEQQLLTVSWSRLVDKGDPAFAVAAWRLWNWHFKEPYQGECVIKKKKKKALVVLLLHFSFFVEHFSTYFWILPCIVVTVPFSYWLICTALWSTLLILNCATVHKHLFLIWLNDVQIKQLLSSGNNNDRQLSKVAHCVCKFWMFWHRWVHQKPQAFIHHRTLHIFFCVKQQIFTIFLHFLF